MAMPRLIEKSRSEGSNRSLREGYQRRSTNRFHRRVLISKDETCLLLAERKYGGSQLDWLLQKDQVARIEFKGLRVGDQVLRVSWRARSDRALQ